MALIDRRIRLDRREMSESEWTKLLIAHGEAVLIGSDQSIARGDVSQAPAAAPSEGLSARRARVESSESAQSQPVQTPDRQRALQEMATRLTGGRKHGKNPR
jgi:hypothetical protein